MLLAFEPHIMKIQPNYLGAVDKFVWQPSKSGIYSAKSGYHSLQSKEPPVAYTIKPTTAGTSVAIDWITDVWDGKFSPKLKVFLWSVIQKTIPSGENLRTREIINNTHCLRCGKEETTTHIFLECPFAQQVWLETPTNQAAHLADQTEFIAALTMTRNDICLPPSGITGNIFP